MNETLCHTPKNGAIVAHEIIYIQATWKDSSGLLTGYCRSVLIEPVRIRGSHIVEVRSRYIVQTPEIRQSVNESSGGTTAPSQITVR